MSNHLAIATVTSAFRQLLTDAVKDIVSSANVDAQRPDGSIKDTRICLFLYHVTPNTALRNSDLPTRNASGIVTNRPTAAFDLHYLLTFYGDESKFEPQRMLGAVVRRMLAEPGLARERILAATTDNGDSMDQSNLANAYEQVKFTPISLSLDELAKIWSVFYQTPYALSIAYLATVVLIDSHEPIQTAKPVLQRGPNDRGVDTQLGPFPTLESIHIGEGDDDGDRLRQPSYPSARLGTIITLRGRNLGGDNLVVKFFHRILAMKDPASPALIMPASITPGKKDEIKISIPNSTLDQSMWLAGIYNVTVDVKNGDTTRSTNSLPLSFAPIIQNIESSIPDANGDVVVTSVLDSVTDIVQSAYLILPDREISADTRVQNLDPLTFPVKKPPSGNVAVRLRVDGIDNLEFKRQPTPPFFVIDQQQVTFP